MKKGTERRGYILNHNVKRKSKVSFAFLRREIMIGTYKVRDYTVVLNNETSTKRLDLVIKSVRYLQISDISVRYLQKSAKYLQTSEISVRYL